MILQHDQNWVFCSCFLMVDVSELSGWSHSELAITNLSSPFKYHSQRCFLHAGTIMMRLPHGSSLHQETESIQMGCDPAGGLARDTGRPLGVIRLSNVRIKPLGTERCWFSTGERHQRGRKPIGSCMSLEARNPQEALVQIP